MTTGAPSHPYPRRDHQLLRKSTLGNSGWARQYDSSLKEWIFHNTKTGEITRQLPHVSSAKQDAPRGSNSQNSNRNSNSGSTCSSVLQSTFAEFEPSGVWLLAAEEHKQFVRDHIIQGRAKVRFNSKSAEDEWDLTEDSNDGSDSNDNNDEAARHKRKQHSKNLVDRFVSLWDDFYRKYSNPCSDTFAEVSLSRSFPSSYTFLNTTTNNNNDDDDIVRFKNFFVEVSPSMAVWDLLRTDRSSLCVFLRADRIMEGQNTRITHEYHITYTKHHRSPRIRIAFKDVRCVVGKNIAICLRLISPDQLINASGFITVHEGTPPLPDDTGSPYAVPTSDDREHLCMLRWWDSRTLPAALRNITKSLTVSIKCAGREVAKSALPLAAEYEEIPSLNTPFYDNSNSNVPHGEYLQLQVVLNAIVFNRDIHRSFAGSTCYAALASTKTDTLLCDPVKVATLPSHSLRLGASSANLADPVKTADGDDPSDFLVYLPLPAREQERQQLFSDHTAHVIIVFVHPEQSAAGNGSLSETPTASPNVRLSPSAHQSLKVATPPTFPFPAKKSPSHANLLRVPLSLAIDSGDTMPATPPPSSPAMQSPSTPPPVLRKAASSLASFPSLPQISPSSMAKQSPHTPGPSSPSPPQSRSPMPSILQQSGADVKEATPKKRSLPFGSAFAFGFLPLVAESSGTIIHNGAYSCEIYKGSPQIGPWSTYEEGLQELEESNFGCSPTIHYQNKAKQDGCQLLRLCSLKLSLNIDAHGIIQDDRIRFVVYRDPNSEEDDESQLVRALSAIVERDGAVLGGVAHSDLRRWMPEICLNINKFYKHASKYQQSPAKAQLLSRSIFTMFTHVACAVVGSHDATLHDSFHACVQSLGVHFISAYIEYLSSAIESLAAATGSSTHKIEEFVAGVSSNTLLTITSYFLNSVATASSFERGELWERYEKLMDCVTDIVERGYSGHDAPGPTNSKSERQRCLKSAVSFVYSFIDASFVSLEVSLILDNLEKQKKFISVLNEIQKTTADDLEAQFIREQMLELMAYIYLPARTRSSMICGGGGDDDDDKENKHSGSSQFGDERSSNRSLDNGQQHEELQYGMEVQYVLLDFCLDILNDIARARSIYRRSDRGPSDISESFIRLLGAVFLQFLPLVPACDSCNVTNELFGLFSLVLELITENANNPALSPTTKTLLGLCAMQYLWEATKSDSTLNNIIIANMPTLSKTESFLSRVLQATRTVCAWNHAPATNDAAMPGEQWIHRRQHQEGSPLFCPELDLQCSAIFLHFSLSVTRRFLPSFHGNSSVLPLLGLTTIDLLTAGRYVQLSPTDGIPANNSNNGSPFVDAGGFADVTRTTMTSTACLRIKRDALQGCWLHLLCHLFIASSCVSSAMFCDNYPQIFSATLKLLLPLEGSTCEYDNVNPLAATSVLCAWSILADQYCANRNLTRAYQHTISLFDGTSDGRIAMLITQRLRSTLMADPLAPFAMVVRAMRDFPGLARPSSPFLSWCSCFAVPSEVASFKHKCVRFVSDVDAIARNFTILANTRQQADEAHDPVSALEELRKSEDDIVDAILGMVSACASCGDISNCVKFMELLVSVHRSLGNAVEAANATLLRLSLSLDSRGALQSNSPKVDLRIARMWELITTGRFAVSLASWSSRQQAGSEYGSNSKNTDSNNTTTLFEHLEEVAKCLELGGRSEMAIELKQKLADAYRAQYAANKRMRSPVISTPQFVERACYHLESAAALYRESTLGFLYAFETDVKYYAVKFFGREFPPTLHNKRFIYRYSSTSDKASRCSRLCNNNFMSLLARLSMKYPSARFLRPIDALDSAGSMPAQCIQILPAFPTDVGDHQRHHNNNDYNDADEALGNNGCYSRNKGSSFYFFEPIPKNDAMFTEEASLKLRGQIVTVGFSCKRVQVQTELSLPWWPARRALVSSEESKLVHELAANEEWLNLHSATLSSLNIAAQNALDSLQRLSTDPYVDAQTASVLSPQQQRQQHQQQQPPYASAETLLIARSVALCRALGSEIDNIIEHNLEYDVGIRRGRKLIRDYETKRELIVKDLFAQAKRERIKENKRREALGEPALPTVLDKNELHIGENEHIQRIGPAIERTIAHLSTSATLYRQLIHQLYALLSRAPSTAATMHSSTAPPSELPSLASLLLSRSTTSHNTEEEAHNNRFLSPLPSTSAALCGSSNAANAFLESLPLDIHTLDLNIAQIGVPV